MNTLDTLDLTAFMNNAMIDVFDTMLDMEVEISDADSHPEMDGNRIVGSVGFAGKVLGSINIHVTDTFARFIAAAMLDMEVDEIEGEEEVEDVIGELSNMIGGDVKSRLCDAGLNCELTIPSITSGSNFKVQPANWARCDRSAFQCRQHTGLLEIYIKSGG